MKSFDRGGLLILSFLLVIMTGLSVPGGAPAAAGDAEGSAGRPAWEEGISYLLGMLTAKENSLDAAKVSGLLDFALAERGAAPTMKPADREGATGAYFFTDVKAPLSKVIRYAYNPQIPAYLTLPSVVRFGGWQAKPSGTSGSFWEKVGEVKTPLLMRGIEYEEITPDLTTGAYYRYTMDRLMVLLNHKGKDFFLSVTRQKSPSTVGRKGAVIGPDSDWNYFYSGQKGLSKTGLGWVDSYMYDASSVIVLFEPFAKKQTRYMSFKWLRAGWGGINMVKRENILEGCRRFAAGFKMVMESPQLPEADRFIDAYARVKALPDQELIARLKPIGQALQKLSRTDPALANRDFQELIQKGTYVEGMSREEREHLLMAEWMKLSLGKHSFLDKTL